MIANLNEGLISSDMTSDLALLEWPPVRRTKRRARRRNKAVRLHDVAQAAGVSIATVSMVVNGNPRISPETQKRVRRFIEHLGYRPSRAAQSSLVSVAPPV